MEVEQTRSIVRLPGPDIYAIRSPFTLRSKKMNAKGISTVSRVPTIAWLSAILLPIAGWIILIEALGRELAMTPMRAVCSDILQFVARVFVISPTARLVGTDSDLGRHAPRVLVVRTGSSLFTYSPRLEAEGPQIAGAVARWFFGAHAATSAERHLSHEADRLASRRARRASTAPDFR